MSNTLERIPRDIPAAVAVPRADAMAVVEKAIPILRTVSAVLDVYGPDRSASELHHAIDALESALPKRDASADRPAFELNQKFKIEKRQVAELLELGYAGSSWYKLQGLSSPRISLFRIRPDQIVTMVDYPLNPGGCIHISAPDSVAKTYRLDLESIARGLDALASRYPRHFADFLIGAADRITGDAFLQCCLFGEIVYE